MSVNFENIRTSFVDYVDKVAGKRSSVEIAVGIAAGSIVTYSLWKYLKSLSLPPGPTGFPFYGNYLQLTDHPEEKFRKWSQKYGKIMSVRIGSRVMVIISDPDIAKEVFNQDNNSGRDQEMVLDMVFKGKGLIQEEGDLLKDHRKFARGVLHDFPRAWLETTILAEVSELSDYIDALNGHSFDLRQHLIHALANVLTKVSLGARFPHSAQEFTDAANLIGDTVKTLGQLTQLQAPPGWPYYPVGESKEKWRSVEYAVQQLVAFVQPAIAQHRNRVTAVGEPDDYVDSYFKEQKTHAIQGQSAYSTFSDDQLLLSVLNLLAPGAETVTSTLLWCFKFMQENPQIAQKVKSEISTVCLQNVLFDDKEKLPYTEATMMECLRLGSTVPLGIYHTNIEETTIGEYKIPQRSIIVANTYAMHRDSEFWDNPEVFRPERFLNSSGKVFTPKGYAPFYIGKRSCLAEYFAKQIVFLFFANILHRYDIKHPDEINPTSKECVSGLIRSPLRFTVRMTITAQKSATETQVRNA